MLYILYYEENKVVCTLSVKTRGVLNKRIAAAVEIAKKVKPMFPHDSWEIQRYNSIFERFDTVACSPERIPF
jgi:hypothetical protein